MSIAVFKEFMSDIGGVVSQGVGIYEQIKTAGKKTTPTPTPTAPVPGSNANLSLKDFAFQPYYPLLIGGAALLVVALLLRK